MTNEKMSALAVQLNTALRNHPRIENINFERITVKRLINEATVKVDQYYKQCTAAGTINENAPTPEHCATILYGFINELMSNL